MTLENQQMPQEDKGSLTAIIDIGSNTIRLVVFHGPARVPLPIFNEKVQCGLGIGLDDTQLLNPKGVQSAYQTLNRFMGLVKIMNVAHLSLLATAAVREAKDAKGFLNQIKQRFGVDVQVLSGEEEAKLAAYGVLSGLPNCDGLIGDMGGASFDLIALDKGKFSKHATTPLGHLRLMNTPHYAPLPMAQHIANHLKPLDWLKHMKGRPFYGVGGSLRAVARLILHHTNHPLHIIDNFTVPFEEAVPLFETLGKLPLQALATTPDISKKRIETLPATICLLQKILTIVEPSALIFSGYSMREGQFFLSLDHKIKKQHPLISACTNLAQREGRFGPQGEEVYDWMAPLFPKETTKRAILRHAACLLHDISWTEHPDYRAEHALLRTLRLPVAGLSHHERALISACVYSRYKGDFKSPAAKPLEFFLSVQDTLWTKTVGAALRLAQTLARGAPHLLKDTKLAVSSDKLILSLPENDDIFVGEAITKRLETIAKSMKLISCIKRNKI